MFIGVLGFFTTLLFVATAIAEIRGEPALARAVALAVMVSLVLVTLRIRRSIARPGTPGTPASSPSGGTRQSGPAPRG